MLSSPVKGVKVREFAQPELKTNGSWMEMTRGNPSRGHAPRRPNYATDPTSMLLNMCSKEDILKRTVDITVIFNNLGTARIGGDYRILGYMICCETGPVLVLSGRMFQLGKTS